MCGAHHMYTHSINREKSNRRNERWDGERTKGWRSGENCGLLTDEQWRRVHSSASAAARMPARRHARTVRIGVGCGREGLGSFLF